MVSLELDGLEIKFLKHLLNLYFHSIDTRTGLKSEPILNDFPGAEAIMVPDRLLRKVEKASEGE